MTVVPPIVANCTGERPASYCGFKITIDPRTVLDGDKVVVKLNLTASSADGQMLNGDSWDELRARIDATLPRGPLQNGGQPADPLDNCRQLDALLLSRIHLTPEARESLAIQLAKLSVRMNELRPFLNSDNIDDWMAMCSEREQIDQRLTADA